MHKEDGIKHLPELCPAGLSIVLGIGKTRIWGCLAWHTAPSCPGGGEGRGALKGCGREWLSCKLSVPDEIPSSALWSLRITSHFCIIQINPTCCISSSCAWFFPCGSLDSHAGMDLPWRHMVPQGSPRVSVECCPVQTHFRSKRSLWFVLSHG